MQSHSDFDFVSQQRQQSLLDLVRTAHENEGEYDEDEEEVDLLPQPEQASSTLAMLLARLDDNAAFVDRAARGHVADVSEDQAQQEEASYQASTSKRTTKKPLPRCPFIDDEAQEGCDSSDYEDCDVGQLDGQIDSDSDGSTVVRRRKRKRLRLAISTDDENVNDHSRSPSLSSISSRTLSESSGQMSINLDQSFPEHHPNNTSLPPLNNKPLSVPEGPYPSMWRKWIMQANDPDFNEDIIDAEREFFDPHTEQDGPGRFMKRPEQIPPGAEVRSDDESELLVMSKRKDDDTTVKVDCDLDSTLCNHGRIVHPTDPIDGHTPPVRDYVNEPFQNKTMEQLVRYIYRKKFKNYVFVSHYGSGFDNLMILRQAIIMGIHCKMIFKGRKVLSLTFVDLNISFLDSFLFVSSSLRSIHSSLGLTCTAKGYFPHLMNKREFYNLQLDHMPDKKYYNPELMKGPERADFEEWYSDCVARGQGFDFTKELLEYNQQDTMVLFLAVRKLIASFLEISYSLWVNGKRDDMMRPCSTEYYYDRQLHANDPDLSCGKFDYYPGVPYVNPEASTDEFRVPTPYPPRRYDLKPTIRPVNLHVFSYITLPGTRVCLL